MLNKLLFALLFVSGPAVIIAVPDADNPMNRCSAESMQALPAVERPGRALSCLSNGDLLTIAQYPAFIALFRDRIFGRSDMSGIQTTLQGMQTNLQQIVARLDNGGVE